MEPSQKAFLHCGLEIRRAVFFQFIQIMHNAVVLILGVVFMCNSLLAADMSPAISPAAPLLTGFEGYGAAARDTTAQTIVKVTNLNDSGKGSLRAALGDNRIVQFSIAGTIKLASDLPVYYHKLTIDGFSSPSPGITLTGAGSYGCMLVFGPGDPNSRQVIPGGHASNVIIQGIRLRSCEGTDIKIGYGAHDIVVDHVSATGGTDGTIDVTTGAHDITLSWNIIANNVDGSGATLIKYETYHVSLHHNIYYNNFGNSRVPWCEGGDDGPNKGPTRDFGVICDIRYNIASKWLIGSMFGTDGRTLTYGNVVSNFYDGQDQDHARNNISISGDPLVSAHVSGNVSVLNPTGCPYSIPVAPRCIKKTNDPNNHVEFSAAPVTGPDVADEEGRLNTWITVLKQAGVVTHYVDDGIDASVRSGITVPSRYIVSQPWNSVGAGGPTPRH